MEINTISSHAYDSNQRYSPKKTTMIPNDFDAFYLQTKLQSDNINQHFINDIIPIPVNNIGTIRHTTSAKPVDLVAANLDNNYVLLPLVNRAINQPNQRMETANDFVKALWPYASQAATILGVEPRLLIAQAALETGWGKYIAHDLNGESSNNLFNIKASPNSKTAVAVKTTEFIDNFPVHTIGSFKKYLSMAESFQDYITLIQANPRYQSALSNANQPEQYAKALQDAGYATDPAYASKLLAIYHGLRTDSNGTIA